MAITEEEPHGLMLLALFQGLFNLPNPLGHCNLQLWIVHAMVFVELGWNGGQTGLTFDLAHHSSIWQLLFDGLGIGYGHSFRVFGLLFSWEHHLSFSIVIRLISSAPQVVITMGPMQCLIQLWTVRHNRRPFCSLASKTAVAEGGQAYSRQTS